MPNYLTNKVYDELSDARGSSRSAFGEDIVTHNSPQFQLDFQYGILEDLVETFSATGGSVTESGNQAVCQTGTSVGGYGVLRSRRFLQYKPGQGGMCRFTALFTTGVSNSLQLAGLGSQENVICFGYNGADFGVLLRTGGLAEIRTLTVTVASTAGTATVQLNGTNFNVSLTGLGSTAGDAWEISQGTYAGWSAQQIGSTVVFTSDSIGAKSGSYSLTGVGSGAGTFAQTRAGAADSDTWIPQTSWNLDKMDGTGQSAITLDPTKGNVYGIRYQWLGYGAITFSVEDPDTGNLQDVHRIKYANKNTSPSVLSPHMHMQYVAASLGSTTNITVRGASMAAFIQGEDRHGGTVRAYSNSKSIGTTLTNIFTLRPARVFKDKYNFGEMHPLILTGASSSTGNKPGLIQVYKDATLGGTPNYSFVDSDSPVIADVSGTTVTGGYLLASFALPSTGSFAEDLSKLDLVLNKSDTITIAAVSTAGTIDFSASLTWAEDH